jgi:hypothetical protein
MSKSVRIRRGSTIDHSQFAGAEGEITVDTTIDTIRVHDGVTLGGWPVLNAAKNSEVTADILSANKIYFKNSFTSQSAFPNATSYPGMLAYSQADVKAYVSINGNWVEVTTPLDLVNYLSGAVTAASGVGDFSLVQGKTGSNAVIKALRAGSNITLESDATGVRIASALYSGLNLNDGAGAQPLYNSTDDVNRRLQFKSLRAGSGVTIVPSTSNAELVLDTVLKQAYNTVRVDATDIATTTASNTIRFISGTGIQLSSNVNDKSVTVGVSLTATNDATQTGTGVLKTYSSGTFTFNKLAAGTGVELSAGVNGEIVINAPQIGTITDAVNLAPPGPTSLGVYRSKANGTLEFYNIAAGSNITIGYDVENKNLVIEAAVGGAAGVGTVQSGILNNLAYYPSTGTAVGDITTGAAWDPVNNRIVANIQGTVTSIANHNTNALAEGTTNVYWTQTRFDSAFSGKTTTGLAEGTNLYFTTERAQNSVSTMFQLGNPNSTTVTTTATANSTSISTIFVASTSGIVSGQAVVATGFPVGVTVQAVGATSFTVSPSVYAPSGTSLVIGGSLVVTTTGNSTSTAQVSILDSTNILNGWYVTGTGIQGKVQVQNVVGNAITLNPGYNATIALGTVLTFKAVSTSGIVSTYSDSLNTFTFNLDSNYLGDLIRSQFNVPANSGLGYDPVQGRFTLSGAVTSVNGYSGAVSLTVGDITGAAPIASPVFTGTPRVATPDNASNILQIANKNYVDAAKLAVTGAPLTGLATIQALGNAINGDTLFYQTIQSGLGSKLSSAGGTMTGLLTLNYLVDSSTNNLTAVNKRYVDQVALVQSVNTKTGIITINTDDVFERVSPAPSNLWFTTARARSSISLSSSDTDVLSYNFNTGAFTFNKPTTDNIQEGVTNKYFTNTLVRNSIAVNVTGNSNFASYNSGTGQITINATSDNLSQGTTNRFYTDTLARGAFTLSTSIGQNSLLTYNNGTGQFTIAAYSGNIAESAGGPYFFTGSRVNSSLAISITQLNSVSASGILGTTYSAGTGVTTFTFNANSNSITEGNTNLYYTDARARAAISVSSTDTSVFNYSNSSGLLTFNKPTTDGITEGITNKYFSQTLSRNSFSLTTTNTSNTGLALASYAPLTGTFTFNANIDSLSDGNTNKFASIGRVAGIISLAVTTNDGASPGNLITYIGDASQAKFTLNNSSDSLREGSVNKFASAGNVRPLISVNTRTLVDGTSQQPLVFNATTSTATFSGRSIIAGAIDFGLYVDPKLATFSPTADGTSSWHLTAVQDLRTTASPTFNKVLKRPNLGVALVSSTVMNVDCSQGQFHEINRNGAVTNLTFTNVPGTGVFFEVIVSILNNVGATGGGGAAFSVSSNTAIKWVNATPPTALAMSQTNGRRDIFRLYTVDGGGTWYELSRALAVA